MPLQIVQVCNFIGHLFWKPYSPSSIASHVSAISYVHKLLPLSYPTNSFIVRKLIKGCNNMSGTSDTRLPITMDILKNIMQGIEPAVQDFYLNNVTCYFPFSFWCIIAFRVNCSKILCWLRKNSSTWGHLYFLQGWTPYQFIFYSATFQNNSNKKTTNPYTFQLRRNQIYHMYVQCLQWIISLKYAGLHKVHYFNLGQVHQLHTSLFLPI